jgi:predicted CoA-binding protein
MTSSYEAFWELQRFAVVGHSARKPFPRLTYGKLKERGKVVYAVDPSRQEIEGDPAYPDLASLPGKVDAIVLEVPRDETGGWMEKAAVTGAKDVWIHQQTETPEAVALAAQHGVRLRTGTCAVMYLNRGFNPHAIHGFLRKLGGNY